MATAKDILQGRPLKHPLHPLLVHFPIGLFFLSLVLDIVSYLVEDGNPYVRGAFYSMALGVITALLAAVPGLADWTSVRRDHPAQRIALYHMILNLVAVALYILDLGLRYQGYTIRSSTGVLPLVVSIVAYLILGFSGYLGGVLVYDDGIAVGRHRRQTELPQQTLTVNGPAGEPIVVADLSLCPPGQTLRASVNGHILAIANIEGRLYAVQDFCTHRYGPLSDGKLEGTTVICPWHRSCFDLSSGQVLHGPAKAPLKTYPIDVQNGQIRVTLTP